MKNVTPLIDYEDYLEVEPRRLEDPLIEKLRHDINRREDKSRFDVKGTNTILSNNSNMKTESFFNNFNSSKFKESNKIFFPDNKFITKKAKASSNTFKANDFKEPKVQIKDINQQVNFYYLF